MRNRAINILEDEMSENTLRHIREIDYLEDWIVDAMIRFHESELKNFHLSDVISSVCGKHCDELRTACDKRKSEYYKWAETQPQMTYNGTVL